MKKQLALLIALAVLLAAGGVMAAETDRWAIKNNSGTETVYVDSSDNLKVDYGYVRIGTGSTPGITQGDDDLFVEGDVEIDGQLRVDNSATFNQVVIFDGVIDIGTAETFTELDTTPNVSTGSFFNTATSTVTITDFDGSGIRAGQFLAVESKGAITYDVTSSGLKGGSTDLVTADGDLTVWLYNGTDWLLISFNDMSDNQS